MRKVDAHSLTKFVEITWGRHALRAHVDGQYPSVDVKAGDHPSAVAKLAQQLCSHDDCGSFSRDSASLGCIARCNACEQHLRKALLVGVHGVAPGRAQYFFLAPRVHGQQRKCAPWAVDGMYGHFRTLLSMGCMENVVWLLCVMKMNILASHTFS